MQEYTKIQITLALNQSKGILFTHKKIMPRIKTIDEFLELSIDLLSNFPSTTFSITYSNVSKKSKTQKELKLNTAIDSTVDSQDKISKKQHTPATHAVTVKLFEPHTGKCLKYKTIKQKELSRILNMLGPQGISNKVGLASLMTNTKFEPPVIAAAVEDKADENFANTTSKEGTPLVNTDENTSGKKKSKKKKKKN